MGSLLSLMLMPRSPLNLMSMRKLLLSLMSMSRFQLRPMSTLSQLLPPSSLLPQLLMLMPQLLMLMPQLSTLPQLLMLLPQLLMLELLLPPHTPDMDTDMPQLPNQLWLPPPLLPLPKLPYQYKLTTLTLATRLHSEKISETLSCNKVTNKDFIDIISYIDHIGL